MGFGEYIRSGRMMDRGYFGNVSGHTRNPPGSAVLGQTDEHTGYVICDRLERPAVAIAAMNPRSLWTPLL
jgi:hypothetical protein